MEGRLGRGWVIIALLWTEEADLKKEWLATVTWWRRECGGGVVAAAGTGPGPLRADGLFAVQRGEPTSPASRLLTFPA